MNWPREPRGSLEGSVCTFRSFWSGGAFKGTSFVIPVVVTQFGKPFGVRKV